VPRRLAVRRLSLTRFRNYAAATLEVDGPAVVLAGPNGAGKTNLLEAVSFLAPGRGLRRARLSEVDRAVPGEPAPGTAWAVAARLDGKLGEVAIGTGRDPEAEGERRLVRIDGVPAKSQAALGDHVTVSWLTPAMDRLFLEGASGRRRFLDRLVFAFDPEHSTRVNGYEHAWRERNRLIKDGVRDPAWYAALEETLAASGVAVAAARAALVARLNRVCAETEAPFPAAALRLDGTVDRWLEEAPALDVEERLRATLAAGRRPGAPEAEGPHRSDLAVRHVAKDMPAERCSTGEQKALLVGIVLAHARLQAVDEGAAPILLLDEVAAHLDDRRRAALFEAVLALGGQAWLTGTDRDVFAPIADRAQILEVTDGRLAPAGIVGFRGETSNG
jgi:DNA replication and repair protein RecF